MFDEELETFSYECTITVKKIKTWEGSIAYILNVHRQEGDEHFHAQSSIHPDYAHAIFAAAKMNAN